MSRRYGYSPGDVACAAAAGVAELARSTGVATSPGSTRRRDPPVGHGRHGAEPGVRPLAAPASGAARPQVSPQARVSERARLRAECGFAGQRVRAGAGGLARPAVAFPVALMVPLVSAGGRMIEEKHWASDVLGGYLGGTAVAAACASAYEAAGRV